MARKVSCRRCGGGQIATRQGSAPVCARCGMLWPTSSRKASPGPKVARERAYARERASARSVPMPVQQKLVLTGRQDFDKLVSGGYLPPPTPEMAADLQRRGVVVRKSYPLRVGDLIGKVAHFLGIPVCAGCSKRRTWLNTHLPRVSVLVWLVLLAGVALGVFKLVV